MTVSPPARFVARSSNRTSSREDIAPPSMTENAPPTISVNRSRAAVSRGVSVERAAAASSRQPSQERRVRVPRQLAAWVGGVPHARLLDAQRDERPLVRHVVVPEAQVPVEPLVHHRTRDTVVVVFELKEGSQRARGRVRRRVQTPAARPDTRPSRTPSSSRPRRSCRPDAAPRARRSPRCWCRCADSWRSRTCSRPACASRP